MADDQLADQEVDYLIVGAGAMGMAFADVLLHETQATMCIVDRRGRPGGHWNDAYPHVRLHQPSAFYGVNSRPLGSGQKDLHGFNAGLHELASGTEVVSYFDHVMQQDFVPSGRVRYLPMSDYQGDRTVRSLATGNQINVRAKKVVDATYMNVSIPSVGGPDYHVVEGMRCVPPNDLAKPEVLPAERYVVIGGGKTAMDACLRLLQLGVAPDRISWIRPRDSWCLNRINIQPGQEFIEHSIGGLATQTEIVAQAESIDDLFERLEAAELLLRIDPAVRPTMYRCATVTPSELEALRTITNVVRKGRVQRIEADQIVLAEGVVPTASSVLHVDCTSDGLAQRPPIPVFDGERITLQPVRTCQQVFSAAFIAHVEAAYGDDHAKNALSAVVPHPNRDTDWLRVTLASGTNSAAWRSDPALVEWLTAARLDAFSEMRGPAGGEPALAGFLRRIAQATPAAAENLQRLLTTAE